MAMLRDSTMSTLKKAGVFLRKTLEKDRRNKVIFAMLFLDLVLLITSIAIAIKSGFVPPYLMIVSVMIYVSVLCYSLGFIFSSRVKAVAMILCGVVAILLVSAAFFVNAITYTLNKVQVGESEKVIYSVIIRKDEERLKSLGYMAGTNFGLLIDENADKVKERLSKEIKRQAGVDYFGAMEERTGLYDLVNEFLNVDSQLKALCLSQMQLQLISEEIDNFDDQIKVIYAFDIEVPSYRNEDIGERPSDDSFVVYFSIADQFDLSDVVSIRNDKTKKYYPFDYIYGLNKVNRLLAVNEETRRILILDIPAELYVKSSDDPNSMDKLSSLGVYGIGKSIGVLEELCDVDINYYVRSTFTNLELVAEAAGVNVDFSQGEDSEKTFDTLVENTARPKTFLPRYNQILMVADKAFRTDMPVKIMTNLIKGQIDGRKKWMLEYYAISGTEEERPLYTLGTNSITSRVLVVDEASLSLAKEKIQDVLMKE